MKLKFTSLLLALVMIMGLIPAIPPVAAAETPPVPLIPCACCENMEDHSKLLYASRVDPENLLIEITPQRVEDTFNYLDEFYVRDYPEAALDVYTGTEEDKEVLKTLAETITKGCTTDKEKADAIDAWLRRNILYDINTSAYATDTFYRRTGNCLSYANLMQFLLRSLGVPAAMGDGWRGDMSNSTASLFDGEGHAWCFVLLDGEWVLYDPLWLSGGTTDRDYIAKWIYLDNVENVCPISDEDSLPPESYDRPKVYYSDGRPWMWSEGSPVGYGTFSLFVNNQAFVFVSNQSEPENGISDGWYYLDSSKDKTAMKRGEVYRDSWVSYGNYAENNAVKLSYAFPNGMMPDGYMKSFDGQDYYMSYASALPILADEDDYWIEDGLITFQTGYSGPAFGLTWQDGFINSGDEEMVIITANENPEIATINDDGSITCHKEGYITCERKLLRIEEDGTQTHISNHFIDIFVSDEERTPDYTDKPLHVHEYHGVTTPSTCLILGYITYSCECGDSYVEDLYSYGPHDFGEWNKIAERLMERSCRVCGECEYMELEESAPEAPVIKSSNVASSGKIKLTWNAVDGAAKYKVYRSTSKNGKYTLMKTVTGGTSYTNTNAVAGKYYYYKVKAFTASGLSSEFSNTAGRTCDLPRPVVKASNVASSGKIKLTWDAVEGAAKYKVYRSSSKNGSYSLMKTVTGTTYTNTSAKAGKLYYYKVVAVHSKSAANSAYSSIVSRTCDLARPTVTISRSSSGKPKLTWKKVDGAVKYQVYRATSKNGTYSLMKTVTGTSYSNTNAKAGKTYYYKVRAVCNQSAANSAYSTVKSIKSN